MPPAVYIALGYVAFGLIWQVTMNRRVNEGTSWQDDAMRMQWYDRGLHVLVILVWPYFVYLVWRHIILGRRH